MSRALLYLISTLLIAGLAAAAPEVNGGLSKTKLVDPEVEEAVNAVSSQIKAKAKVPSGTTLLTAGYATQTVAGINYFVKIMLGPPIGRFIHAKIFMDLKGKYSLVSIRESGGGDPITFF
ncbi:cystatin-A-like [Paramacrobiotus metropolitanus]|uniref:cystatin-A-like n=1 Tax=Paramacrobiotus metropolitanus TaxID=2943436 RepID=UPI0024465BA0|nr:cystatin-A-like [Paramacrobiotus metropolitanus]